MLVAGETADAAPELVVGSLQVEFGPELVIPIDRAELDFDGTGTSRWVKFDATAVAYWQVSVGGGPQPGESCVGSYNIQVWTSSDGTAAALTRVSSSVVFGVTLNGTAWGLHADARWIYVEFQPAAPYAADRGVTVGSLDTFPRAYAAGASVVTARLPLRVRPDPVVGRTDVTDPEVDVRPWLDPVIGGTTVSSVADVSRFADPVAGHTAISIRPPLIAADDIADAPDVSANGTVLTGSAPWDVFEASINSGELELTTETFSYPYTVWHKLELPAGAYTIRDNYADALRLNDVFNGTEMAVYTGPPDASYAELINVLAAPQDLELSNGPAGYPCMLSFILAEPSWVYVQHAAYSDDSTTSGPTVLERRQLPVHMEWMPAVALATGAAAVTAEATIQKPAGNDLFADRLVLTTGGTITGSTVGAGIEPGEPFPIGSNPSASVWFEWVCPADGVYTFSTVGSDFDTVLNIYTASVDNPGFSDLTRWASDDDSGGNGTSQLTHDFASGVHYYVQVYGYFSGVTGNYQLTYPPAAATPTSPEPVHGATSVTVTAVVQETAGNNDLLANAHLLLRDGTLQGDNTAFGTEPNEPTIFSGYGASAWFKWIPADNSGWPFEAIVDAPTKVALTFFRLDGDTLSFDNLTQSGYAYPDSNDAVTYFSGSDISPGEETWFIQLTTSGGTGPYTFQHPGGLAAPTGAATPDPVAGTTSVTAQAEITGPITINYGHKCLYLAQRVNDLLLGRSAYTPPSVLYVALSTAPFRIDATGDDLDEVTATDYGRATLVNDGTAWSMADATGSKATLLEIRFPTPITAWGAARSIYLLDAVSGGNALYGADLQSATDIAVGYAPVIAPGDLVVQEV